VLISGHHANITRWRRQQSLKRTYFKRPDLFEKLNLKKEDRELLKEALEQNDE
jgi:tRNA (guanine37-N1)-methyltransferase